MSERRQTDSIRNVALLFGDSGDDDSDGDDDDSGNDEDNDNIIAGEQHDTTTDNSYSNSNNKTSGTKLDNETESYSGTSDEQFYQLIHVIEY